MILIKIALTIMLAMYLLIMPSNFVHEWMKNILREETNPFRKTVKETDWIDVLWWLVIGLLFTGGVSELWKI